MIEALSRRVAFTFQSQVLEPSSRNGTSCKFWMYVYFLENGVGETATQRACETRPQIRLIRGWRRARREEAALLQRVRVLTFKAHLSVLRAVESERVRDG